MNGNVTTDRWQTKITTLKQGIAKIYETKDFEDIQFLVQGEYYFKAHKLILTARSPEFAKMLMDPNVPELIIVDEETITKDGFDLLLRFIYTDTLGTSDKRVIIEGYLAAIYYKQKALQAKCEEVIDAWVITTDDVCRLFELGTKISVLRKKCVQFMMFNGRAMINSPSFLTANYGSICSMLKYDALVRVPVLQRIDAIMKWFTNHYLPNAVDFSDVRETLQTSSDIPLLDKLRFEKLNLEQLSEVTDNYEGLLTAEEVTKFMKYQRKKDASLLPSWCIPEEK